MEEKIEVRRESRPVIKITFGDINKNNFEQMRQLNNLCLPIRYQDGFYYKILRQNRFGKFGKQPFKIAYYNDIIFGAISWKYDIYLGERVIYIMTITVLEPYRRYQIGSQLLQELIRIHKNIKEIKYINLHVQVSNIAAKNFYVKNGFDMVKIVENYYTDIEPKDAFYLRLRTQD